MNKIKKFLVFGVLSLILAPSLAYGLGSTVGGIKSLFEDLSPELGGDLDANNYNITDVGTLAAQDITASSVTTDNLTTAVTLVSSADAVISNASPSLIGKDTNNTDSDPAGQIDLADCTDTGSGTEDCNMTFSQMFNGTLKSFLLSDADGYLQVLKDMYLGANIIMGTDKYITTGTAEGDGFYISPWDVDGATYSGLGLTLVAGDTPTVSANLSTVTINAGNGTETIRPRGLFCSSVTATGNVLTGEDDLISCTMPADTMANNGDVVVYEGHGTVTSNINAKRIRARIGTALLFDTGALPVGAAFDWAITCKIWRNGATSQRASCEWTSTNATVPSLMDVTTTGADFTTNLALKFTGEAVSTADIIQNAGAASFSPTS